MVIIGSTEITGRTGLANPSTSITVLLEGNIRFSLGFENPPRLSVSFTNCSRKRELELERIYTTGKTVTFEGYEFLFKRGTRKHQKDRQHAIIVQRNGRIEIKVYDFDIEFEWIHTVAISKTVTIRLPNKKNTVTLAEIASAAGVPCFASHTFKVNESGKDTVYQTSLLNALQSVARIKGGFIYYDKNSIGIKKLRSGGSGTTGARLILSEEVITSNEISCYINSKLTWGRQQDDSPSTTEFNNNDNLAESFTIKEPELTTLIKESLNVEKPPLGSDLLQTLDSNGHKSGPKKDRVETDYIDGQPIQSRVTVWGFAYTSKDIWDTDLERLYSLEPQLYWKIIETQTTDYIYKEAGASTFSLNAVDNTGKTVQLIVHPEHRQFVTSDFLLGNSVSFKSKTKFLIKTVTKGIRYLPLKEESGQEYLEAWLDFQDGALSQAEFDRYQTVYEIRPLPTIAEQQYVLRSIRYDTDRFLKETEKTEATRESPFQVEWRNYVDLPASWKLSISPYTNITSDLKVGIVTVDPNYEEKYYVKQEVDGKYAFAWALDPEDDGETIPPPPPIITGEESRTETVREITAKDRYVEIVSIASAQNPSFADLYEQATREEKSGSPPSPTTLKTNWVRQENNTPPPKPDPNQEGKDYYITSSPKTKYSPNRGDVSYEQASTLQEALTAAETDLEIEAINTNQSRYTIGYYWVPEIGNSFKGGIITSVEISLDYESDNRQTFIKSFSGTNISVGKKANVSISHSEKARGATAAKNDNAPQERINFEGTNTDELGEITFDIPHRRRF